jgi:predicted Zn-dependent peptidase
VEPNELERARAYTLGALAIRQQSAASVLSDIADAWLLGNLDELEALPRIIAGLTQADLQAAARASIDPARAVWGIVRASG